MTEARDWIIFNIKFCLSFNEKDKVSWYWNNYQKQ